MTLVTTIVPVCEECTKKITDPNDGFIIIGDIFNAAVTAAGVPFNPLVGPSFPTPPAKVHGQRNPDDWEVNFGHIQKHCLCLDCLLEVLKIPHRPIPRPGIREGRRIFNPDDVEFVPGSGPGVELKGYPDDPARPRTARTDMVDHCEQPMSEDQ